MDVWVHLLATCLVIFNPIDENPVGRNAREPIKASSEVIFIIQSVDQGVWVEESEEVCRIRIN